MAQTATTSSGGLELARLAEQTTFASPEFREHALIRDEAV
jgi:hypothetical protein